MTSLGSLDSHIPSFIRKASLEFRLIFAFKPGTLVFIDWYFASHILSRTDKVQPMEGNVASVERILSATS